jgi:hypothetical protein
MLEVESLVGQAVQTVVTESPSWLPHRDILVNILIEALESKASWVDLFGITGELDVPGTDAQGELLKPLQRAKEVCGSCYCYVRMAFIFCNQVLRVNRHSYPPQGTWREIKIPVDVPRMSVSFRSSCLTLRMVETHSFRLKDCCSRLYPHPIYPIFDGGFDRPLTATVRRPAYFRRSHNHNIISLGREQE